MKITCNIIRDLLPLYAENIANEDTIDLIDEHIKECESCERKLKELKSPMKIPTIIEEAGIRKMQKNHIWIIANFLFALLIIVTTIWTVYCFTDRNVTISDYNTLEFEFETNILYEHTENNSNIYIQAITTEEIQETLDYYDYTFNPDFIIGEMLNLYIYGDKIYGDKFRDAVVTKEPHENGKFIYYVQPYDSISGRYSRNSYMIRDFDSYDNKHESVDDYVAAIYIVTEDNDYLIYGEHVSTEKFDVEKPILVAEFIVLIGIILACICLYNRLFNKKLTDKKRSIIDIISLALAIFLLNSWFITGLTLSSSDMFTNIYSVYNVINIMTISMCIIGFVIINKFILKIFKEDTSKKYKLAVMFMNIWVGLSFVFEKMRMLENMSWRISPEYHFQFFIPIEIIVVSIMLMIGYFMYKTDLNKGKQFISKEYKIMQSILIVNLVVLQNLVLYMYSLKGDSIGEYVREDGRLIYLNWISMADIVNLSACVMLVYGFYLLLKRKDYMMLMIMLQCVVISMEKTNYFSMHLGNLNMMDDLSYYIFVLSYISIALSVYVVNRLKRVSDK